MKGDPLLPERGERLGQPVILAYPVGDFDRDPANHLTVNHRGFFHGTEQ